jgi:imidazolonepropionase-like amidohydrolase
VASGQRADLVLLDENPLADIVSVRRIRAVVVAGRFLDREALDKMLARVKRAARQ